MLNVYFLFRRLTTGLLIILLNERPDFQVIFLMHMSFINLLYIVVEKPYLSKTLNYTEI